MKYTVLNNLKHNGEIFTQGDQIELPKEVGYPLEKDGVLSSARVPIVKQKDWKKGPEDIKRDPEDELKPTGEIGKVNEDDGEEVEKEEETETTEEETIEQESKIAGAQDDTSKIDEDADKDL